MDIRNRIRERLDIYINEVGETRHDDRVLHEKTGAEWTREMHLAYCLGRRFGVTQGWVGALTWVLELLEVDAET